MIKIAHAVANYDNIDGDSSGREILVTKWYKRTGGWLYLLKCTDQDMAEKAAKYAKLIADNDNYGYSKDTGSGGRWSGYNSIKSLKAAGLTVEEAIAKGRGNFDCSSFCITCYILAGLKHKATGYTGSMWNSFKETGKFALYDGDEYVASDSFAGVGSLYLMPKAHVAMSLENGSPAQEDTTVVRGPQIKSLGSVRVRKEPKTGKTIDILRKGDKATVMFVDETTGWYFIKFGNVEGYVTNNERYVRYSE